ncbi:bifunctional riboflavin kinase/FAD synthetase [Candidatus Desulforudis audaxviator]|uniref:Riboflavin biosynthesis protein n=1 Tax=Desulforudis audaxviator (strain MP104C) TaxID=477974 RepID=B1I389_DESAP|nr:bifunctional riboflavin kinase/FAD synthetase [Candidatus Desulforudis audaxviator]ACA59443.1 riboflavin biosynthesis protein RibF [Candidatus Desulforudis audaxviator MP104C]AZK59425.1 Riboflavin kinase [Candidatus Desulforudis audaxviator]
MDLRTNFKNLRQDYPRLVLGLGNFDGVHLGHQELIRRMVERARRLGGVPGIFTFHPHPVSVLRPEHAPPLLLTQETKEEIIAGLGVRLLLRIPFTLEFARLSPEEFIRDVLYTQLGVVSVFVGYNYTFGHRGRGTPATLAQLSQIYGFETNVVEPVEVAGEVVSSTRIRELLSRGRVEEARRFLGFAPFVDGMVVSGDGRGRRLGFPTANLETSPDILIPANGVYAVKAEISGQRHSGVANIGYRPTFTGADSGRNLEVHLFDVADNLYGKSMRVFFSRYIRGERKFGSPAELIRQIEADIRQARAVE